MPVIARHDGNLPAIQRKVLVVRTILTAVMILTLPSAAAFQPAERPPFARRLILYALVVLFLLIAGLATGRFRASRKTWEELQWWQKGLYCLAVAVIFWAMFICWPMTCWPFW
jgi:protein-S-isoprenylcysteine O-methyltransferase Ste14